MNPSAIQVNSVTTQGLVSRYKRIVSKGRSIQINGNISMFRHSSKRKLKEKCLKNLQDTSPSPTNPTEYREAFLETKGHRSKGTCEWIKTNAIYQEWHKPNSTLLWISGGPGKGKTMLSTFLAEELERVIENEKKGQSFVLLQYFCDNNDEGRNSAVVILRGLMCQLVKKCPQLIKHVLQAYRERRQELFTNSFHTLWTCFENMLADKLVARVYCVIDGLDECREESIKRLLEKLRAFTKQKQSAKSNFRPHVILLSREYPQVLTDELSGFQQIKLDSDAKFNVNSDIESFIEEKVEMLSQKREYPEGLKTHVVSFFKENAKGTFLWVAVAIKELEPYPPNEVRSVLKNCTSGLNELYSRMLQQTNSKQPLIRAKILRWVTMAVRPLTLLELGAALEITPQDDIGLGSERIVTDEVNGCGNILTIITTARGREVILVHQSAKDYLLHQASDEFRIDIKATHLEISRKCLTHLKEGLQGGFVDFQRHKSHVERFPLLEYAVLCWTEHAQCLSDPDLDIFKPSHPIYDERPLRDAWIKSFWIVKTGRSPPGKFTIFHIASYFRLVALVEKVCSEFGSNWQSHLKEVINIKDTRGTTALHIAAAKGEVVIAKILLKHGADPNAVDKSNEPVILWASKWGNPEMRKLLLEYGATDISDQEWKEHGDPIARSKHK